MALDQHFPSPSVSLGPIRSAHPYGFPLLVLVGHGLCRTSAPDSLRLLRLRSFQRHGGPFPLHRRLFVPRTVAVAVPFLDSLLSRLSEPGGFPCLSALASGPGMVSLLALWRVK